MPGGNGQKVSEGEFETHTPGNDKYLVNFNVVPLGQELARWILKTYENLGLRSQYSTKRATARTFLTSEKNNGHEKQFCTGPDYDPDQTRPPTGTKTGNVGSLSTAAMRVCPAGSYACLKKEIIWGHGGLWSDILGSVWRSLPHAFSLECRRGARFFSTGSCSNAPDTLQTEPGQIALKPKDTCQRRPLRAKNSQ